MRGASVRVTALLAPLLGLLVALFWIGGASGLEIPTQADSLVRRTEEYECPSNCSNKGHCIMGKCYCLFGYSGDNCAIVSDVVALKPGGSYKGHITGRSWRYFTVNIAGSSPGHLQIELVALANVSLHGASEGLELRSQLAMFVNNDPEALPDEGNFKSRCIPKTGCSTSNKLELRVEEPQGSTWTIGIRSGQKDEYFSIGVETPLGLCSDSCSGRGVCLRGRCCCKPGSKGSKCEETQGSKSMPVAVNSEVPGNVARDGWRHYFLSQMRSAGTLRVTLKILSFSRSSASGGGQRVHLVVNKSGAPLAAAAMVAKQYEHACDIPRRRINDTSGAECALEIENPGPYAWFVGILGDGLEANYVLETELVGSCPHECGGNGDCNAALGKCFCRSGYTGADCYRSAQDLPFAISAGEGRPGQGQGFLLAGNETRLHKIVVPEGFSENLDIFVQDRSGGGAPRAAPIGEALALRLQSGVAPTQISSLVTTSVAYGGGGMVSLSPALRSSEQVFWLSVQSPGGSMYTVTAKESKSQCEHDCNGQGFCYKGACQCHPGFAGPSCGYHLSTEAAGIFTTGLSHKIQLEPHRWTAFNFGQTFEVSSPESYFRIDVSLEEDGGTVVSVGQKTNFTCEDIAVVLYNDRVETLVDGGQRPERGTCQLRLPLKPGSFHLPRMEFLWQRGGNGGQLGSQKGNFLLEYDVVVECPNNCSGAGACQKGVCVCNHDRTGPDCSKIKPQLIAYEQQTLDSEKRSYYDDYEDYGEDGHQQHEHHTEGGGDVGEARVAEGSGDSSAEEEDDGMVRMDENAAFSGYLVVGSIFLLIFSLTVYMRYSDRQRSGKGRGDGDGDLGGNLTGSPSKLNYARKTGSYASLLDRVDEEENLPSEAVQQASSQKTALSNIQLPLPNMTKGLQMRQRKTASWGLLSDLENRGSAYEAYQETQNHVAISVE